MELNDHASRLMEGRLAYALTSGTEPAIVTARLERILTSNDWGIVVKEEMGDITPVKRHRRVVNDTLIS